MQDVFAAHRQELAEQQAAGERAYRQNVAVFERMWLTLGSDDQA
jgi:hypothetical protein